MGFLVIGGIVFLLYQYGFLNPLLEKLPGEAGMKAKYGLPLQSYIDVNGAVNQCGRIAPVMTGVPEPAGKYFYYDPLSGGHYCGPVTADNPASVQAPPAPVPTGVSGMGYWG